MLKSSLNTECDVTALSSNQTGTKYFRHWQQELLLHDILRNAVFIYVQNVYANSNFANFTSCGINSEKKRFLNFVD